MLAWILIAAAFGALYGVFAMFRWTFALIERKYAELREQA